MHRLDYYEPKTEEEACRLLSELGGNGRILARGTDVIGDWPILKGLLHVATGASWVSMISEPEGYAAEEQLCLMELKNLKNA